MWRLPEGYFEGAPKPPSFLISVFAAVCAGLAAGAVFLMFQTFRTGRNHKRETGNPFPVPPELDSASLAFAWGGVPRNRLLLSLVLWLVSKGCMKVKEEDGTVSRAPDEGCASSAAACAHVPARPVRIRQGKLGAPGPLPAGFSRVLEKSFQQLEDGFQGERRLGNGLGGRMALMAFAISLAASAAISLAGWHHSFMVHFGAVMGGTIVLGFLGTGMIYTSGRHSGRGLWIRVVLPVLCMAGLLFGVVTAFRLLADAVMVNLYYDAWLWICLGSVCTAVSGSGACL